jgi:Secretory lipase
VRHSHHAHTQLSSAGRHHGPRHRPHRWKWLLGIAVAILAYWIIILGGPGELYAPNFTPDTEPPARAGDVMGIDGIKTYNVAEATALIRQNYGSAAPAASAAITKVTYHFRTQLPDGHFIAVFARAYVPTKPLGKLPVFGFATGTTGIGDKCAPSLEDVHKANWGNYDSHMAAYAAQGYAAVTTDYEGMRDPTRIHHYMVGELEGRVVLDSLKALDNIPETKGVARLDQVFLGGYSQGGHAVFWADKLAPTYAPTIKVRGVVGWGPVMSVEQTLTDVVHGANINWFGPYVLYSYQDYYHPGYDPASVLLPHWAATLSTDVPAHCIDTDIPFWGKSPDGVYTPEFLTAVREGKLSDALPQFSRELADNAITDSTTRTPKRINQGQQDNVVLPSQAQSALTTLCSSSKGPVQLALYPNTTHYDNMVHSFKDTLEWMNEIRTGGNLPSTCP